MKSSKSRRPASSRPRHSSARVLPRSERAPERIAEDWVLTESLGFFQQLGVVESREELLARAAG